MWAGKKIVKRRNRNYKLTVLHGKTHYLSQGILATKVNYGTS